MSTIWTDSQIDQFAADALQQLTQEVSCLYDRFWLGVQSGLSTYTLDPKVIGIESIKYRGLDLDPLGWQEFELLAYNSVYVSPSTSIEYTGRPRFYALHPTNIRDVRLFPAPNETLGTAPISGSSPFSPTLNEPYCTVSCWRNVDDTHPLPLYVVRRTQKAYILWKCFSVEGKGQNIRASEYYKKKWEMLVQRFKSINDGAYISKIYSLDDTFGGLERGRVPKPSLPSNFERVYF